MFSAVEVVVGRLDLAAVEDLVAEPEEDVLDLAADLGDQVQVAARGADAREGDVDLLGRQRAVELGRARARRARSSTAASRRSRRAFRRIAGLAVAHLAQRLLEVALPAEVADAQPRRARSSVAALEIALRASFSSLSASTRRLYHRPPRTLHAARPALSGSG